MKLRTAWAVWFVGFLIMSQVGKEAIPIFMICSAILMFWTFGRFASWVFGDSTARVRFERDYYTHKYYEQR